MFYLTLISRRSRYRAGTRYKRRGVDSHGSVANFVESELIILVGSQKFSFVQVRGSIPIFWSQSGHKYRPIPLLTKDYHATKLALELHITDQLKHYQQLSIINLVDEIGRESIIKEAFELHLKDIQSPNDLRYIYFDFNKQCKGFHYLKFQNLLLHIEDHIQSYKFFWSSFKNQQKVDLLCEQKGVFRVNCMDCLDRTNVVQATIARQILDIALMKLGLLMPDQSLPPSCLQSYRRLWANNGDAISRQYAGTAALKGDLTRTGHRNLKGTVRDGLSSANRYYINNFKDSLRQSVIDSMQDDFTSISIKYDPFWNDIGTEESETNNDNSLIHAIRDYLDLNESIRGWALKEPDGFKCISCSTSDQLCILLLLNFGILILLYENSTDDVVSYEFIEFSLIKKVQFGILNKYKLLERKHAIRIHFNSNGKTGYHYTFCSLFSKPDDIKLELNIINNELKFKTSLLNLFPIFVSIKLLNQPSIAHNIIDISNSSPAGEENLNDLKIMINEKSHHIFLSNQKNSDCILAKDAHSRVPSSSIENLSSNDYPNALMFESLQQSKESAQLCFAEQDSDSINQLVCFPLSKSVSDDSIYSHSSNTGIKPSSSKTISKSSRTRADTSSNLILFSPNKSKYLFDSFNGRSEVNDTFDFDGNFNFSGAIIKNTTDPHISN